MGTRRIALLAAGLLALGLLAPAVADETKQVKADEQRLEAAKLKHDGASLLALLRQRSLTDTEREGMRLLVRKLGAKSFREREQASNELVARGPVVLELLKEVLQDADLEVARRAEKCMQLIRQKDHAPEVIAAAARLVGARKPEGAVEVLLTYLPFADNESVAEEVRGSLAKLAVRDGKPDKALVAALQDKNPVRRGGAADALCKANVADLKPAVRKLLKDSEPQVRFRAAAALAYAGERAAVQELIDLLEPLPQTLAWQAEELLFRLADGKTPPAVSLGKDAAARKKCREAWDKWWKDNGEKVDLVKLREAPKLLGYTLVVLLDMGQILELDRANEVRWKLDNLAFPLDVQLLADDRVLVAEYHGSRVTEREIRTGAVKWQRVVAGPLMAQRLDNGNTFIATDTQLLEVDPKGKTVFTHTFQGGEKVMKAMKLPNGEIACMTTSPRVLRLDPTGKEVHSFALELGTRLFGGRVYMQPNGHVLVPHNNENKVVEYDAAGKQVWKVDIDQPVAAVRLPNGHTLVTTMTQNRAVEFDRAGNEVWQYRSTTRVTRALRR